MPKEDYVVQGLLAPSRNFATHSAHQDFLATAFVPFLQTLQCCDYLLPLRSDLLRQIIVPKMVYEAPISAICNQAEIRLNRLLQVLRRGHTLTLLMRLHDAD